MVNGCFTDASFAQLHGEILQNCPSKMFRVIGSRQLRDQEPVSGWFSPDEGVSILQKCTVCFTDFQLSHLKVSLNTCVFLRRKTL